MRRSILRLVAVFVLALLGAPVAMHVVMHDLHHEHAAVDGSSATARSHGDHEHPVVSAPPAPLPGLTRTALVIVAAPAAPVAHSTRMTASERNVMAFGALRTDTDVGLQPLLATFLI